MPSESARLQAALRSYGLSGATVTSVAAPLIATARNHLPDGAKLLVCTMSGTSVVDVSFFGSTIPLAYPFAMPTQRAALQSALRSAGYDCAVVMLHAATWSVYIPNRIAIGQTRAMVLDITPGDPFAVWDMYGNYQGDNPAAIVTGAFSNVRAPGAGPLSESNKGFARLGFIPI